MSRPKFVADSMLGTVAKKLRILGFDCRYFPAIGDDEILALADTEKRAVITRDRVLAQKCEKQKIPVTQLASHTEMEQLIEIAKSNGLSGYDLDTASARCSTCNGTLEPVGRDIVKPMVPERVFSQVTGFWQCQDCTHVYWEGTHIRNVRRVIDEINARLQDNR